MKHTIARNRAAAEVRIAFSHFLPPTERVLISRLPNMLSNPRSYFVRLGACGLNPVYFGVGVEATFLMRLARMPLPLMSNTSSVTSPLSFLTKVTCPSRTVK